MCSVRAASARRAGLDCCPRAVAMAAETAAAVRPDMAEVMPGVCPRVIRRLTEAGRLPVIAGGMIETKEDMIEALSAGAAGVSTSRKELWSR